MKRASVKGFTIIEVVLFLAITGGLFAALMVGVNSNLTQQRYRESVSSLYAFLQDQYNEVNNPRNEERNKALTCTDGAIVVDEVASGDARGASDKCVLLGKAITVESSGTVLKVSSVIGTERSSIDLSGDDIDALREYRPFLEFNNLSQQSKELDAGLSLKQRDNKPSELSILIVRSPVSGLLYVFASKDAGDLKDQSNLGDMITTANQKDLKQCIWSSDIAGLLPIFSIEIKPQIAGPEGIIIDGNGASCANLS